MSEVDRLGNIERSIECESGCGDCPACDLANMKRDRDRWLREYRIEKQNNSFLRDDLRGAVEDARELVRLGGLRDEKMTNADWQRWIELSLKYAETSVGGQ
jgi:hypothetical protein